MAAAQRKVQFQLFGEQTRSVGRKHPQCVIRQNSDIHKTWCTKGITVLNRLLRPTHSQVPEAQRRPGSVNHPFSSVRTAAGRNGQWQIQAYFSSTEPPVAAQSSHQLLIHNRDAFRRRKQHQTTYLGQYRRQCKGWPCCCSRMSSEVASRRTSLIVCVGLSRTAAPRRRSQNAFLRVCDSETPVQFLRELQVGQAHPVSKANKPNAVESHINLSDPSIEYKIALVEYDS